MRRYKFIKDRTATPKEVFDNLKNGGLKLLCVNHNNNTTSQVAWCGDGTIEIITIENDKRIAEYFMSFTYRDLFQLKENTKFFENKVWWFGYIKD